MSGEQLKQESLIRQRMAEEETVPGRIDEDGNKWTKVYFGGRAHLRNWLSQFVGLKSEENVQVEEIDSRGFRCFEGREKKCAVYG
jgi:hypothetical protein